MRARSVLLLLVLLLVTGCGQGSVSFDFDEVRYTLTGGVAGFNRVLQVKPDGSYEVFEETQSIGRGRLAGADLRQLKELLAAVEWLELQPAYTDPTVADALFGTVLLRVGEQAHETVVGTGGSPPPAVAALAEYLAEELSRLYLHERT